MTPSLRRLAASVTVAAAAVAGTLLSTPALAQTQFTMGGIEVRAFLARNSSVVYAAGYGSGLHQSVDSGATWFRVNLNSANPRYMTSIAGNSSTTMVVGAEEGLFSSTDGTNFTQRLYEPVSAVAMGAGASTTVLAAVKGLGILRSTDSGVSFAAANNAGFPGTDIIALAAHPSVSTTFYAAAKPDGAGNRGGVFVSTDGGANWSASTAIDNAGSINYVYSLTVDTSSNVFAAVLRLNGTGGVYKQTGGAGAWALGSNTFGDVSVHRDANTGTTIWCGERNLGIRRSVAGGSYLDQAPNNGGSPSFFYNAVNTIATLPGSSVVLMAMKGAGVWRTTSANGTSTAWAQVRFPGAERVLSATGVAGLGNTMLLGLHAGGVWRSDTAGNAASTFNPPTVNAGQADFSYAAGTTAVSPFNSIWQLAASPSNPNLIYAATGNVGMNYGNDNPGIFRWDGTKWNGIGSGAASGAPWNIVQETGSIFMPSAPVYGVSLNSGDDTVVYASYLGGSFGSIRRLNPGNWTIIATPAVTPQLRATISAVANTAWVVALPFDDKPVRSTDFGATYSTVSVSQTGFERLRFFAAAENPTNGNRWIGATNKGMYISSDAGVTWTRVAITGQVLQAISAVGFKSNGKAFAADFAGNRYCSADSGVSWVSAGAQLRAGVNAIKAIGANLFYLTDGAGAFREDGSC